VDAKLMPTPQFLLQTAAKHGQAEAIRLVYNALLKDGRNPQHPWELNIAGGVHQDEIPPKWCIYEDGVIHSALEGSNPLAVFKLFAEYGMKPDHNLDRAINPTAHAIAMNNVELVRYFLAQGANPTGRYIQREDTYLGAATRHPQSYMLELLLEHGSKLEGSQALRQAVERGQIRNAEILLDRGADVNETFTQYNFHEGRDKVWGCPLHFAISPWESQVRGASKPEVVQFLLFRGAKPELRNGQGKTTLDLAVEEKEEAVVRILSDYSPEVQS